jgi:NAD+ diphosphatase
MMQDFNVFAGAFVDRSGERRKDPAWLEQAAKSLNSRFVPVWRERCLVGGDSPHVVLLQRKQIERYINHGHLIFLGLFRDQPAFAVAIITELAPPFSELGEFQDLRFIGTVLPHDEANLAAHARALVLWHQSQVFCGICGSQTKQDSGGNSRKCCGCGKRLFPRVDPAIIVLVSDGERCLLGRQESWPEGRYSTISGFVEPGESLEDGVRREVFEETNVRVGEISYHSSQPWPFPAALMLGFTAEAENQHIKLNDGELEDARWFTREQLRANDMKLPFRISIARRLVDNFLQQGG